MIKNQNAKVTNNNAQPSVGPVKKDARPRCNPVQKGDPPLMDLGQAEMEDQSQKWDDS